MYVSTALEHGLREVIGRRVVEGLWGWVWTMHGRLVEAL